MTAIHTTGVSPVEHWSWYDAGARIHNRSDGDYVVTQDGKQWPIEEQK